MKKIMKIFFGLILVYMMRGCTHNPFFNENSIVQHLSFRGSVTLDDWTQLPENVFVWLEILDINARTDQEGFFQINIPPPNQQPGGGLNGSFKCYFYISNYRFEYIEIVLLNGFLELEKGDINADGIVNKPILLNKILNVEASVMPPPLIDITSNPVLIPSDYYGKIEITLSLRAIGDTVEVIIPKMMGNIITAAFLQGAEPTTQSIFKPLENQVFTGNTTNTISIGNSVIELPIWLQWPPITRRVIEYYPLGFYEIIPFIMVKNESIPPALIDNLGSEVTSFNENYLNYPVKRINGLFKLVDPVSIGD